MLDIFAKFATDENLEEGGTWRKIGGGAELLVARGGNEKYRKALTKAVERHEAELATEDDAADKVSEQIMVDVIASTLLLDWKNVSYQGQALDYSVSNAKKLLAHKDFRKLVVKLAEDMEAYKVKEEAEQGEA